MDEEIENIETTLNLIKSSLKQVIKTITEEFADLTELINSKKNKIMTRKHFPSHLEIILYF